MYLPATKQVHIIYRNLPRLQSARLVYSISPEIVYLILWYTLVGA